MYEAHIYNENYKMSVTCIEHTEIPTKLLFFCKETNNNVNNKNNVTCLIFFNKSFLALYISQLNCIWYRKSCTTYNCWKVICECMLTVILCSVRTHDLDNDKAYGSVVALVGPCQHILCIFM